MRTIVASILLILISAFGFYQKDYKPEQIKINSISQNVQDDEAEVMAAAKNGLQGMLNAIPAGYEKLYGFENRESFGLAEPGRPYRVYTLTADFLKTENAGLKNYIVPLDLWRVPVLVNGTAVSLLTVEKHGNRWKVVDLGGSGLAKEMYLVEKNFTQYSGCKILLRLYQIQCDFLVYVNDNSPVSDGAFYPLQSAKIAFEGQDLMKKSPCFLDELTPLIKVKYTESFKYKNR